MSISYEGIGQVMATCKAGINTEEGLVVKMRGNDTVTPCSAGERFCGVAGPISEDGYAAVQFKGFVTVPCGDSTVTAGYVALTADGDGGVKAAGSSDQSMTLLVVSVGDGWAVICL